VNFDRIIEVIGRSCYLDGVLNETLCQDKLHDLSILNGVMSSLIAEAEMDLAVARNEIKKSPAYQRNFKSGREADRELDDMCYKEYHNLVLAKSLERGLAQTERSTLTLVSSLRPKF